MQCYQQWAKSAKYSQQAYSIHEKIWNNSTEKISTNIIHQNTGFLVGTSIKIMWSLNPNSEYRTSKCVWHSSLDNKGYLLYLPLTFVWVYFNENISKDTFLRYMRFTGGAAYLDAWFKVCRKQCMEKMA